MQAVAVAFIEKTVYSVRVLSCPCGSLIVFALPLMKTIVGRG